MKNKRILNALGQVNEKYIEEAAPAERANKKGWFKWGTIAACVCLVVAATLTIPNMLGRNSVIIDVPRHPDTSASMSNPQPSKITPVQGNEPVYYSDLALPKGKADKEIIDQFNSNMNMIDIAAFDESLLSNCVAILEGEITDMYLKEYSFTTSDDKFGEGGTLNHSMATVVYELCVNKVWYSNATFSGTILIEDRSFFPDEIFSMKAGHRYVVPIYEAGNEVWTTHEEYISGEITRDSIYSTIYPFHPQIEVTGDNAYIVSTDWETLTAENVRSIIMDAEMNLDGGFYKDKMVLVPSETFSNQMAMLIAQIAQQEHESTEPVIENLSNADTDIIAGTETIDPAIEQVAREYYSGTVFEVISTDVKSFTADEVIFSVHVSKGGVVQEPDRTIYLELHDGSWEVVNEGY